MIQVVTFTMTMVRLSKKLRSGFPCSPPIAMADPVVMEKITNPRVLVPFDNAPLKSQVFLCYG